MKKVVIQCDDVVKYFDNVTKVECFLAFDTFNNEIKIYQNNKVTTFKQYEINGLEIKD